MLTKSTINKIKNLQKKKYRNRFSEFVIEGVKGVQEALDSGFVVKIILATETALAKLDLPADTNAKIISDKDGKRISNTETFPGVLAVVGMPEEVEFDNGPVVCLDRVSDPGNLGTIVRTADWFGIKNILLSEDSVDPYNPKVVRSTMGSIFRTNILESTNIIHSLEEWKEKGYNLVSLTMGGKDISKLQPSDKTIYVFGSESHGVRAEIIKLGESYTISGVGEAESLNVAVGAGITLHSIQDL